MIVTDRADYVGCVTGMPGIEYAAQFLVVAKEGIGLVYQQCRRPFLNRTEDRGRGDVRGRHGPIHQSREQPQHRGFPASLLWRGNCENGRHPYMLDAIGKHDPQGKEGIAMLWDYREASAYTAKLCE